MPEGDAVWRTARRLHHALAGRQLLGADLRWPSLATSGADLVGRQTELVIPRGKHLLHRLEGGLTLHSHLRMDGSWRVVRARVDHDGRSPRLPAATHRHTVRAVLWTDEVVAVGDTLGMLDLVPTAAEHRLVGHLGPDLLAPAFDADLAVRNLLADPARPVAEALLDQRNLAGLGTIYTSEPLFLTGTDPWCRVADLGPDRLGEIVRTAREMLQDSCAARVPAPPGWVFGRVGRPCRRCGATIRQGAVGEQPRERVLSYCPGCQPATSSRSRSSRVEASDGADSGSKRAVKKRSVGGS